MLSTSRVFLPLIKKQLFFYSTLFPNIPKLPRDPILGLVEEFKKDPSPVKVNLSAGTYRDENGEPYVLNCVREANQIYTKENHNHEYVPITGIPEYVKLSVKFAYSPSCVPLKKGLITGIQCLSGTGSIRIGFEFLSKCYEGNKKIYLPNPTWPNHLNIASRAGLSIGKYRYFDLKKKCIDIEGLIEDIENIPDKSIILFHACAHNPTGMDINNDQWKDILEIVLAKKHLPFFDMAYQGFSSGNPDIDAYSVRLFANKGINMLLTQSFAKNFGLYGQRVGTLSMICKSKKETEAVDSQFKFLARASYSNPPKYGAMLVNIILSSPSLTRMWHGELKKMSGRIIHMRSRLYDGLKENGSEIDWSHIKKQIGMFAFTGLNKEMTQILKKKYHIYLTENGRISIAGINESNVNYVAKAFHEVTMNKKI